MNAGVHFEIPYDNRARMVQFQGSAFGWKMRMLGEDKGNYVVATTTETGESGPEKPGAINGGFFPKKADRPEQQPAVVIAADDINESIKTLEPISESIQQDFDGSESHKTEEVLRMILPSSQESALPPKPCKEPLNQPSPAIEAKLSSVLRLLNAILPVRSNHLNAFFREVFIKEIAVVCLVSNQSLGLRLDHGKIKHQLHQGYLMMVRRMRSRGDRQAVSVYNSHYFQSLASLRLADPTAELQRPGRDDLLWHGQAGARTADRAGAAALGKPHQSAKGRQQRVVSEFRHGACPQP